MAVANTYTLEGGYGSHVVVKGAGFLLNNEMGDFNKKPGETNNTGDIGTPANVIAPGKRMLSSMTPTIVTKDGKLVLHHRVARRPHDHQHGLHDRLGRHRVRPERTRGGRPAAHAPSVDAGPCDASSENRLPDETVAKLKAMGHDVRIAERQGDAHSIWFAPDGTAYGAADKRTPDSKASVPGRLTAGAAGR